jgi:hypothetical protein
MSIQANQNGQAQAVLNTATVVFETLWKLAAERHRIYLKRLAGESGYVLESKEKKNCPGL